MVEQIKIQLRYILPLWFVQLLTNWLPDNRLTIGLRGFLIRPFLKSCGKNLQIAKNVTFLNPFGIHFGNDIYIATGCWLDVIGGLTIEMKSNSVLMLLSRPVRIVLRTTLFDLADLEQHLLRLVKVPGLHPMWWWRLGLPLGLAR